MNTIEELSTKGLVWAEDPDTGTVTVVRAQGVARTPELDKALAEGHYAATALSEVGDTLVEVYYRAG